MVERPARRALVPWAAARCVAVLPQEATGAIGMLAPAAPSPFAAVGRGRDALRPVLRSR
jgi:hypothetical protein